MKVENIWVTDLEGVVYKGREALMDRWKAVFAQETQARTLAEVISGSAERFDVMASVPSKQFPGGTMLRWPGLVAGMLFYSLRDRLG